MIRITRVVDDPKRTVLKVEGNVAADTGDMLLDECRKLFAEGKSIDLDLAGVNYVDEPGAAMLLQIQAERVGLINCSGFVKAILRATKRGIDPGLGPFS